MNIVITKDEFDNKYVGEKIVVHCPTEELAKEFLMKADEFGYKWYTEKRYIGNINYELDNCYEISRGFFSSKAYYLNRGYKVVEFNGFKDIGYDKHFKVILKLNDENFEHCLMMCEESIQKSLRVLVDQKYKDVFFENVDKSVFYIKKEYIKYVKTEAL